MVSPIPFVRRSEWSLAARHGIVEATGTYAQQCLLLDAVAFQGNGTALVGLVAAELFDRFVAERFSDGRASVVEYLQFAAPLALYRPGCGDILDVQFGAVIALEMMGKARGLGPGRGSAEREAERTVEKIVRQAATAAVNVSFSGMSGMDAVDMYVDLVDIVRAAAAIDAIRALLILRGVAGGELLLDGVALTA
jgi:hypothetical protein